jgi:hypothetical protein
LDEELAIHVCNVLAKSGGGGRSAGCGSEVEAVKMVVLLKCVRTVIW